MSLSKPKYRELCLFSDASNRVKRAVAYIRMVRFVMAKAKLSPRPESTIPHLEVCGAVLAVELVELILDELDLKPDAVKFYCDSKVVLGYIFNDSKRFFAYVHNRVHRIRQTTSPEQWHYVPSEQNPVDLATRSVAASQLMDTRWFKGPDFLNKPSKPDMQEQFASFSGSINSNVRTEVTVLATQIEAKTLTPEIFQRFSTCKALLRAISFLIHQLRSHKSTFNSDSQPRCTAWHSWSKPQIPDELAAARRLIIETVQRDSFPEEHVAFQAKREIPD